jgi:hypothetical protein
MNIVELNNEVQEVRPKVKVSKKKAKEENIVLATEADLPKVLGELNPDDEIIQEILSYLATFKVPQVSNGRGRSASFGTHRAMTLGMIRARKTKEYGLSYNSKKHPELYEAIKKLGEKIVPFAFNAIHVNNNVVCPRHLDPYNSGASVIVSFGDYEGCDLVVEGCGTFNTNLKPLLFNGAKFYHYNTPLISGNKYSFVFFTNSH